MKFLKFFLFIIVVLGLFGCVAKGPAHTAYSQKDSATIDGTIANFFKIAFGSDANVWITSIDNKSALGSLYAIHVSPGEHTIAVSSNTGTNGANGLIKVTLKANHQYKLRAKASEKYFTVYLFDITNTNKSHLISAFKIKARGYN